MAIEIDSMTLERHAFGFEQPALLTRRCAAGGKRDPPLGIDDAVPGHPAGGGQDAQGPSHPPCASSNACALGHPAVGGHFAAGNPPYHRVNFFIEIGR